MKDLVPIGVSNRHVHLTKEVYDTLFNESMTVAFPVSQPGEFASNQKVTLEANGVLMEGVRVMGPCRNYNQVEISRSDARKFKLNPPVRRSGDLTGAETITIKTEKNKVSLKACIIPNRHVHMSYEMLKYYGLEDNEKIKVALGGEKSGIIDVYVKASEGGVLEMHIDTDDANAFMIEKDTKGNMLL